MTYAELQDRIRKLAREASALDAAGRHDEAKIVAAEGDALRQQLDEFNARRHDATVGARTPRVLRGAR